MVDLPHCRTRPKSDNPSPTRVKKSHPVDDDQGSREETWSQTVVGVAQCESGSQNEGETAHVSQDQGGHHELRLLVHSPHQSHLRLYQQHRSSRQEILVSASSLFTAFHSTALSYIITGTVLSQTLDSEEFNHSLLIGF